MYVVKCVVSGIPALHFSIVRLLMDLYIALVLRVKKHGDGHEPCPCVLAREIEINKEGNKDSEMMLRCGAAAGGRGRGEPLMG